MNTIAESLNLDNKKILFLAETHFQFMNCINIAHHTTNSQCDLYINEMYDDAKEYAAQIDTFKLFRNVKTYNVGFGKVKKAITFLTFKRYVLKQFGYFDYDFVFFASRDYLARCVITYCKYINPSIKLVSYDEGLGTYISRMESYTNKIEKAYISLRYHDDANIVTDKILYKPEAYIGESENITLYRMPSVDNYVVSLINQLYNYENSKRFIGNIIYFDNYYDGKDDNKKHIIECLAKKTNARLVIKKHPQTPKGAYNSGNIYQYAGLPYEVIAANDMDIQEKTLITIMSTAVWTPMLMFNRFPKIILLYPLFDNGEVNEAKKIIEKMISFYPEDKITVIRTNEELDRLTLE